MSLTISAPAATGADTRVPVACNDAGEQLRAALRRLAKAVVVITCRHRGARYAMAATAVSELSMDPPSLLVCVNRGASIFQPLSQAEYFGACILHSSQRAISQNCSGTVKGEARFKLGNWAENEDGLPYLLNAQASIFCRREQRVDYGTHGVFFGRVLSAHTNGDVSPLIYLDGRYGGARECG